jgi:hypothetical protein
VSEGEIADWNGLVAWPGKAQEKVRQSPVQQPSLLRSKRVKSEWTTDNSLNPSVAHCLVNTTDF